jgi:hypothetical protein
MTASGLVSLMDYDLGYFDGDDPKVRSGQKCYPCDSYILLPVSPSLTEGNGAPGGIRTPDPLLRRQTLSPTELRAHSLKELKFRT